jgi:MEMO1 family protein
MLDLALRPRLRPGLEAASDEQTDHFYLYDTWRQSPRPLRLTSGEFRLVELMNGRNTMAQIQAASLAQSAGRGAAALAALIARLDESLLLDGKRWQERLASPVREPSCLGTYAEDAAELRQQLFELFTHKDASGLPRPSARPDGKLRAVLAPHIDYGRGGLAYTWAFKELVENTTASLFVIIGTSHYSLHRFTLTRKHFKTPLGVVQTDQDYVDRLVRHFGSGLFDDEMQAHLPEHSIELEVVLLQYLLANRRPFHIVPLVVGSFHDAIVARKSPDKSADIEAMIRALHEVEAELAAPPAYIISGDLAHIGPKFGDSKRVDSRWLKQSESGDRGLVASAERADMDGYFQAIAKEDDRRRICGLPPTYTLLQALQPKSGKLLGYDQYMHPSGFESVSFASMGFYR